MYSGVRGITWSIQLVSGSGKSAVLMRPNRSMRAGVEGPKFGCHTELPVKSTCSASLYLPLL
eukprot:6021166-Prymnesium_polylepis.1